MRATVYDAEIIRKLEQKIWKEEVTNKYDMPIFIRYGHVFIAKDDEHIIGAIISFCTKNNEVFVTDLVVDKEYRGQGIAENLYKKLLTTVKGFDVISFLEIDRTETVLLHKKLGAKTIKKVDDAYGIIGGLEKGPRLLVKIKNT